MGDVDGKRVVVERQLCILMAGHEGEHDWCPDTSTEDGE
jgi:hypothetical protein